VARPAFLNLGFFYLSLDRRNIFDFQRVSPQAAADSPCHSAAFTCTSNARGNGRSIPIQTEKS
jgi:hypothetical protein